MDTINISRIPYFASVVEAGSFTAAANRLRVKKALVSHQVAKLEEELGTALLIRNTRHVSVTQAGNLFYARCAEILQLTYQAVSELNEDHEKPSGILRIGATQDFGTKVVAPAVRAYLDRYPSMRVELEFDDRLTDLVSNQIDLSIRVGWLTDSSILSRRIGTFRQTVVVAASRPDWAAAVLHPSDLEKKPWIANKALKSPLRWHFASEQGDARVDLHATVSADTTAATLACALSGTGLTILPDYVVMDDLKRGNLIEVLQGWRLPEGGIYLVYPPSRYRPAKTTRFVEAIMETHRATLR